jgi:tRNA(Ile)-lysidine synthase
VFNARIIEDPKDAVGAAVLARASEVFERRLDRSSRAPLAVGFSGGGDSLALLLAARAWAAEAGRPLLALTVDHGINPLSAAWTDQAAKIAGRLGAQFRALTWEGPKPTAGLPATARRARHALLAEAAREAGASVLLLGHTRDDVGEAAWMRSQGSNVGDPREWAPSPVWPEGRGVFLLRPLLGLGRSELRDLIAPSGLCWIEDPANEDDRFLRSRARRASAPASAGPSPLGPAAGFEADEAGVVRLDRHRDMDTRLLAMACVSAGGGEKLPRRDAIQRLVSRIGTGERFTATLAGARLDAGQEVVICRDAGRLAKASLPLAEGRAMVWDGRFEIMAERPGLSVLPLGGSMSRLDKRSRERLGAFPQMARRAMPGFIDGDGTVTCPILAQDAFGWARGLVSGRLRAACGRIAREPAPWTGSHGERDAGALS